VVGGFGEGFEPGVRVCCEGEVGDVGKCGDARGVVGWSIILVEDIVE